MANNRKKYDFSLAIGANLDNSFNSTMKSVGNKVEKIGSSIEKTFDNACGKAIKGVSAVGAAIGGLSIAGAISEDKENRKLQAQLGATADEMKAIGAVSKEIFKTGLVEDIASANNIMLELGRTMEGLSDQDKLEVGTQIATLNMTYETDTAELTRAADSIMKSFGASASEAMDYVGWGLQNNLDFSGEFLDTINEYGPQFKAAGYTAQEMFAILKAGTEGGAWNLDKVGDAAKEFGLRIKDGSKTTEDAMKELSKPTREVYKEMLSGSASVSTAMGSIVAELSGMEDQTEAFRIAQSLFGTTGEDLTMDTLYNLYNIGAETIEVTGTVEEMANILKGSVGVQLSAAMNQGKLALNDMGKEVLTVFMPAIQAGINGLESFTQWFGGLDDGTKKAIVTVGAVVTSLGPLAMGISMVGKVLSIASIAIKGIGIAITFFTGPVGVAVAAFGLLAAGAVYVATHTEQLQAKFQEVGAKISTTAGNIKDSIIGGIGSAIDFVTDGLSNMGQMAGEFIKTPINVGIGLANDAIGKVNEVSLTVPEWVPGVGGKTLGFSIPTIPALAAGGIATSPTLAMIGEGGESEAVIPLSKLEAMISPKTNMPQVIIHNHFDGKVLPEVAKAAEDITAIVKREIENFMHRKQRLSLGG